MKVRLGFLGLGFLMILFGGIVLSCDTEGTVDLAYKDHFIKYYGDDGNQIAKDFVVNDDGSIVMVGTSIEANGDTSRIYLVKADSEGNVIWAKKLGTGRETARDIDVFSAGSPFAGHYMILSNCKRMNSDSTDVKVLVVDAQGIAVDSTIYDTYPTQYGYSLTGLSDGGFVITGNVDPSSLPGDNGDLSYVDIKDNLSVRYDKNLNEMSPGWITSFGGEPYAMGVKILERTATQFLYAGYSNAKLPGPDGNHDMNMVFSTLDVNGFSIPPYLHSDDLMSDKDEIMSGITRSTTGLYMAIGTRIDVNNHKIYACIIDGLFSNVLNEGTIFNGPDRADGVAVSESSINANTFWVIANETRTGGRNIWVGRVNTDLETEIQFTFGGSNNDDTGSAIKELRNGDLLILGTMELVNQTKMALIKVRPDGSFK